MQNVLSSTLHKYNPGQNYVDISAKYIRNDFLQINCAPTPPEQC